MPCMLVGPYWHLASNVSRRDGVKTFIWNGGCAHARAIQSAEVFIPADQRAEVEQRWHVATEILFKHRTEHWKPEERAAFRSRLGFDSPLVQPSSRDDSLMHDFGAAMK